MLARAGHHVALSNHKLVGPDRQFPLLRLDVRASLLLYRNLGQRLPRTFYKLLENSGSGLLWLPLVPVVWAAPGTPLAARTCAANLFLGLLVDLAFVGTLKGIVRRARPVYNEAGDFLLVAAVDRFSFPSGHAARCPADGRTCYASILLLWSPLLYKACMQGGIPGAVCGCMVGGQSACACGWSGRVGSSSGGVPLPDGPPFSGRHPGRPACGCHDNSCHHKGVVPWAAAASATCLGKSLLVVKLTQTYAWAQGTFGAADCWITPQLSEQLHRDAAHWVQQLRRPA